MKKIIKKIKSNSLFTFILGGLIFGSIGIYGANKYQSNTIEYSPTDASWEVSNVNEAINSLYSMKNELNITKTSLNNLKAIGDATAAQILSGKKAVVKGNTITGTMTDNGAWTNTPTSSGKVTIPAGYHNGSGYVDTSSVYEAGYNNGYDETHTQTMTLLINNSANTYTPVQSDIGKIFIISSYNTPTFPSGWKLFNHMHESFKQVYTWIGTVDSVGGYFQLESIYGALARLD